MHAVVLRWNAAASLIDRRINVTSPRRADRPSYVYVYGFVPI